MFAAVDVFYDESNNSARAACVMFRDPRSDVVEEEAVATISRIAPYAPGEFYRRELPCIEAIIRPRLACVDLLLIDGYVYLSPDQKPGLGWHVHQSLSVPIIGIAKTRFKDADKFADNGSPRWQQAAAVRNPDRLPRLRGHSRGADARRSSHSDAPTPGRSVGSTQTLMRHTLFA